MFRATDISYHGSEFIDICSLVKRIQRRRKVQNNFEIYTSIFALLVKLNYDYQKQTVATDLVFLEFYYMYIEEIKPKTGVQTA